MATWLRPGPMSIELERDDEGYREYKVKWKVRGAGGPSGDGPYNVLNTPGLPLPGAPYALLGEADPFVWCRPGAQIKVFGPEEDATWWTVEQTFSNKPLAQDKERCNDIAIDNPLLEPPKISGGLINFQEEATHDRFGRGITTSSWEQIRGQQVEFDASRHRVRIEQNVAVLDLALCEAMKHTVNIAPLWGFPRRCIKLSDFQWERKFQGLCQVYYTRSFEFDINRNTWDRDILDEGTKALNGRWDFETGEWVLLAIDQVFTPLDPFNPQHFSQYKDRNGENTRVILNGQGIPAGAMNTTTNQFVSITASNQGNPLKDSANWVPLAGPFSDLVSPFVAPPNWQTSAQYIRGNIVELLGYYIAKVNQPRIGVTPPTNAAEWAAVPNRVDLGAYDAGTLYTNGNLVTDTQTTREAAGYIHVERYNESQFLLLGIPAVIG